MISTFLDLTLSEPTASKISLTKGLGGNSRFLTATVLGLDGVAAAFAAGLRVVVVFLRAVDLLFLGVGVFFAVVIVVFKSKC